MDWVQAIRDIGFPIVVSLLLLLKLDASLNRLREAVEENTRILRVGFRVMNGHKEEDVHGKR
ncbi:ribonuclease Z [Thermus phage phiKo]|nr:ribonuclease Z [Thermus phage phiKo]